MNHDGNSTGAVGNWQYGIGNKFPSSEGARRFETSLADTVKRLRDLAPQARGFENNLGSSVSSAPVPQRRSRRFPIAVLGVPFDPLTIAEALASILEMIESGRPHYLVTPNIDFLVQAQHDVELRRILLDADLVLVDGMPIVWASKLLGNPLPERLAGSDLVPLLIQAAAEKSYRIFFLGGSRESASLAVERLLANYPEVKIVGCESPPYSDLLEMDHERLACRIRAARPDLLFVCFGCPKQEKWMAMHFRTLGVPVSIGVGGTIDFLAGRLARAPQWMRKTGFEWCFRLAQEPRRLMGRYIRDIWGFNRAFMDQWIGLGQAWNFHRFVSRRPEEVVRRPVTPADTRSSSQVAARLIAPAQLRRRTVETISSEWENALESHVTLELDLSQVLSIDSTGLGFLIRLQKGARRSSRLLLLKAPSGAVVRAIDRMKVRSYFNWTTDSGSPGGDPLDSARTSEHGNVQSQFIPREPTLAWTGEIVAANALVIWERTEQFLRCYGGSHKELTIDLRALGFIDSTGVSVMVRARRVALQFGLKLRFRNAHGDVLNVLRISKLERNLLVDPP